MINQIYVDMLALKIFTKEINPKTNLPFKIEDILKEDYKEPVLLKIKVLEEEKAQQEQDKIIN